tara:strand:- start:210 stop:461 length:252 start_codon:yes stop_codon:yes gene_type:complete
MRMTAEISMYPLRDNCIPPIKAVIDKLNSFEDIQVKTFTTATTLVGDYEIVMDALKETLAWSYEQFGIAVFVTKLIPGYDSEA